MYEELLSSLNRLDESDHRVTIGLAEFTEFLDAAAGITLGVTVPHDGFDDVAGAAVMQTVVGTGAFLAQTTSPQRVVRHHPVRMSLTMYMRC